MNRCLLYGVTDDCDITLPAVGVQGRPLQGMLVGGLRAHYSHMSEDTRFTADDAVQFHRVTMAIFDATTIIPFRFATVLTQDAIADHLSRYADRYMECMERIRDMEQWEWRIEVDGPPPLEGPRPSACGSGRAYLEARAAALRECSLKAKTIEATVGDIAREWQKNANGERLYALVPKAERQKVRAAIQNMPEEKGVRATGPWIPTEFVRLVVSE